MTQIQSNSVRTYNEAIQQYALGQLSPAKHLMINCLKQVSTEVFDRVKLEEGFAISELDEISTQSLSPEFIANVVSDLPPQNDFVENNKPAFDIDGAIENVTWNKFIPMVSVHNIIGSRKTAGAERLYLIRVKAGAKVPQHSHGGEEWVLVLKGSYTSNGIVFKRGDIHMVDEHEAHSLEISGDEDCICLAMSEENIKMTGILPRIAQKFIGI